MSTVSTSFTEAGVSALLSIQPGESLDYAVSGTFVGTVVIDQSDSPLAAWRASGVSAAAAASGTLKNETRGALFYRFRCSAYTSGTIVTSLADSTKTLETVVGKDGVTRRQTTEAGEAITGNLSVSGTSALTGALTLTGEQYTGAGVGAKNGSTVSVVEKGNGVVHQTVLTLTDTPFAIVNGTEYAGVKVYDFPEGRILVLGAVATMAQKTTSAIAGTINETANFDWSVGSVVASNVALATTMVDLIPKVDGASSATINVAAAASSGALAAAAAFDGTATPVDAFLNVAFPTTGDVDADGTMTMTGTITITWINLGDF